VTLCYAMTTLERHMAQYRAFKETADLPGAAPPSRVELLFLAAYHVTESDLAEAVRSFETVEKLYLQVLG